MPRDFITLADLRRSPSSASRATDAAGTKSRASLPRADMRLPEFKTILANCEKVHAFSVYDGCKAKCGA
jgi:hypothetical protein